MDKKLNDKINLARHKLLEELAKVYSNRTSSMDEAIDVGMTISEIEDFLGDDSKYIDYIVSELISEKEIIFFDLKRGKGYMINDVKGMLATVNGRYKDRVHLKNFSKTSMVISLILSAITVGILFVQTVTKQKVLVEFEEQVNKSQEETLNKLESLIEIHNNHHNNDSLIVASETKTKNTN